jgi:arsenate reductase
VTAARNGPGSRPATVLFACVHNAGRSQMAAALFERAADPGQAHAVSAGTRPAERVHPEVEDALAEIGIDVSDATPRRLDDALAREADLLVTMGCGEECPFVPGLEVLDWEIEDPKGKEPGRVREIREEIGRRVGALVRERGWGPSEPRGSSQPGDQG